METRSVGVDSESGGPAKWSPPNDAIVFQACDDPLDSHHAELQAMAGEIAVLRTRDARQYRLFPLPWAKPILDGGRRLAAEGGARAL